MYESIDQTLTDRQKYNVSQVVASLELEDMHPDRETIMELERLAKNETTIEKSIEELNRRYANG